VVLLHPKEVNQAKGTLDLLANSLTKCTVIEGENFSDNRVLLDILSYYGDNVALLYPSEKALLLESAGRVDNVSNLNDADGAAEIMILIEPPSQQIDNNYVSEKNKVKCIILLDATWKKAYRMYQLSRNLHRIKHLALPEYLVGQYAIRKTKKEHALSPDPMRVDA